MTSPTYFTVIGDFKSIVADTVGDSDADPDSVSLLATVTFTPRINDGDLILATNASPRPTAFVAAPISGTVGSDGILKLRDAGSSGYPGLGYTPVRLLADTALLELDGDLFYDVTFSNVSYNGRFITLNGFRFQAPTSDVTLNLVTVARAPGQPATAITKIAPTGVRFDGSNMVFSFSGVDIPEPLPLSSITGPQGPMGPQGIQGQAGVSLDINGTVSTYANLPGSAADGEAYVVAADGKLYYRFDGAWPAQGQGVPFVGPQGPTGAQGLMGSSGIPGVSGIPGEVGATGPVGATGASGASGGTGGTGLAGQSVSLKGAVATYSLLPGSATVGDAYVLLSDQLLYVWNGSWPSEGSGVPWVGPAGASGASGVPGLDGASGVPGASGASGIPGASGASGTPGIDGASGAVGASGGTGGTGGTGAPGASGVGAARNISLISTPTTLGSTSGTDYVAFITGASGTITLPGASGNTNTYTVTNQHSTSVNVSAPDKLMSLSSLPIPQNSSVILGSNGSTWRILSSHGVNNIYEKTATLVTGTAALTSAGSVGVPPTGWTSLNVSTATLAQDGATRTYSSTQNVNHQIEYRTLASSSNYEVTIQLSDLSAPLTSNNLVLVGLYLRESSSGKLISYTCGANTQDVTRASWTSPTGTSSQTNTAIPFGARWLRITDNGTDRIFAYSVDGSSWTTQVTESRTTYITADQIGWGFRWTLNVSGTATGRVSKWTLV